MMFMAGSLNLITIYIGLECLALASYALTGMLRGSAKSTEASLKYILIGAISSGVILFGMSLVFGVAGSVHLAEINAALAGGTPMLPVLLAGMVFLVAGLGVKMAAVPFHMWAPDVYHGAPAPVAAFLITASEAAAFAAALRIFLVGLPAIQEHWTTVFVALAVITMTFGNVTAIVQTNMRRMLAYSAVAQAGYVMVGLAVASERAVSAMIYYLIAYAFATIGAFAVVILLGRYHPAEDIGLPGPGPAGAAAGPYLDGVHAELYRRPPTAGFSASSICSSPRWRPACLATLIMVLNSMVSILLLGRGADHVFSEARRTRPCRRPRACAGQRDPVWRPPSPGLFPDQVITTGDAVQNSAALLSGGL